MLPETVQCRRCCQEEETSNHLFFTCLHAQAIWRGACILNPLILDTSVDFEMKLHAIIDGNSNQSLSYFHRQYPLWILGRIWKSRNTLVYSHRHNILSLDIYLAKKETSEWILALKYGYLLSID